MGRIGEDKKSLCIKAGRITEFILEQIFSWSIQSLLYDAFHDLSSLVISRDGYHLCKVPAQNSTYQEANSLSSPLKSGLNL